MAETNCPCDRGLTAVRGTRKRMYTVIIFMVGQLLGPIRKKVIKKVRDLQLNISG